jgi:hypothetical protein
MNAAERLELIDKLVSEEKSPAEIRPHLAALKQEIHEIAKIATEVALLKSQNEDLLLLNEANPAGFLAHFEHDARKGLYRRRTQPDLGWFCASCLCKKPMAVSLVEKHDHGWHCRVCKELYVDRDAHHPPRPTAYAPPAES